jgi:hypothetical protein
MFGKVCQERAQTNYVGIAGPDRVLQNSNVNILKVLAFLRHKDFFEAIQGRRLHRKFCLQIQMQMYLKCAE